MKAIVFTLILLNSLPSMAQESGEIAYSKSLKELSEFTHMLQDHYSKLLHGLEDQASLIDQETLRNNQIASSLCEVLGSTDSLQTDHFNKLFHYFNLTNDRILMYGTDDDNKRMKRTRPFFDLYSSETVYQLISIQNEHIRAKGFCSDFAESVRLDFEYNVLAVSPGNVADLERSFSLIVSEAARLRARIEKLPEYDQEIWLEVTGSVIEDPCSTSWSEVDV